MSGIIFWYTWIIIAYEFIKLAIPAESLNLFNITKEILKDKDKVDSILDREFEGKDIYHIYGYMSFLIIEIALYPLFLIILLFTGYWYIAVLILFMSVFFKKLNATAIVFNSVATILLLLIIIFA